MRLGVLVGEPEADHLAHGLGVDDQAFHAALLEQLEFNENELDLLALLVAQYPGALATHPSGAHELGGLHRVFRLLADDTLVTLPRARVSGYRH